MNKTVAIVCVTAIVVAVIGLIGWVSSAGGDIERILGWSGTILGPMLAVLGSVLMVRQVNEHVGAVKKDIQIVKVQTNGKMHVLGERLDELERAENGST